MVNQDGILTVNLAALVRNWQRLNTLVGAAQCAAVVKANAYGLGMVPVATALLAAGCGCFFVATVDEALELRAAIGQEPDIIVLGGVRAGRELELVGVRAWPSLFSMEAIERWRRATDVNGQSAPCVLKINTGMTRLGLDLDELAVLTADPAAHRLNVQIFMSHLACADEAPHPLNHLQLERFNHAAESAQSVWPAARLSLANSSGIFLGAQWHQHLVRPGAALYGINPMPGSANPVEPVVNLKLPVIQYRLLTEAAQVGYSATASCQPGQRLAVVLGGYADGLQRQLSGRGVGELCGQRVSMLGRVSMDTIIFDISGLAAEQLPAVGEAYIEVLNQTLTVDVVAEQMNTIGYEVLTSLGARYLRHYLEDGYSGAAGSVVVDAGVEVGEP